MAKPNLKTGSRAKVTPVLNPRRNLLLISGIILVAVATVFFIVKASPDSVSDTFTDDTKFNTGTTKVSVATSTGDISLAECYQADPSWTKVGENLTVRNMASSAITDTIIKDLYCDDYNCIFVTYKATVSSTICIATDPDVYGNILWAAADSGSSKTWGTTSTALAGGNVGGIHPAGFKVGTSNQSIGGFAWIERNYDSPYGTYPAMDLCKSKGNGWRLPTVLEFDGIRDASSTPISTNTKLPGVVWATYYWTSTENEAVSAFTFGTRYGYTEAYGKTTGYYVRCVRGQ